MYADKVTAMVSRNDGAEYRGARAAGYFMTGVLRGTFWRSLRVAAATCAAVAFAMIATFGVSAASAADAGIMKRGDAAVTGFSGTVTDKDVPKTVHPLDRTFIDLNGSAAQVFDLSVMGTAPRGQLSDVLSKLKIKARDTGQVFGVTLDDAAQPNIYLTATSMYGLQIVTKGSDGKLNRLVAGAADAQWMPGQFGLEKGGTPGAIYKVNGVSGEVTLFATVKTWERDNAGPGLGKITFDPRTQQLFVSDLESGLIHRITLDGKERDLFDHGDAGRKAQGLDAVAYDDTRRMDITQPSFNTEDPTSWGYADARRRVFGLAVSTGRLYYAVAEGPAIWSVSIDNEGDFGSDPRIEIELKGTPAATDITDIVLDDAGKMYL